VIQEIVELDKVEKMVRNTNTINPFEPEPENEKQSSANESEDDGESAMLELNHKSLRLL